VTEGTELATQGQGANVASLGGSLLNFVAQAVSDPNVDVGKLEALLRMQREIVGEDARVQFIQAMKEAQAEIMPVVRDSENTQTKSFYAKLEAVDAAIRPIYIRHGFSLSFDEEAGDGTNMLIVCEVSHVAGHAKKYRLNAPPDTLGPKGTPTKTILHGRGSTVTFLRRYLTCNIFNVVLRNQDDDGVRGGTRFISEAEAAELRDLIKQAGRQEGPFLDRLFSGTVRSMEEIEAGAYVVVRNTLDGIIHQQKQKAAT
jgi:ERF superfamily